MKQYNLRAPLNDNIINNLNNIAKQETVVIIFENTKGLRIRDLEKLDNRIKISITGGLNPKKNKFDTYNYQERTYYSKNELIKIIEQFEKIERKINPIWTQFEKTMFVYKKLCEYLNYDYDNTILNGRDATRNLLGLITGKSVCSGCALIFKEAMDRIGIKCHYQNMMCNHSWNVIEIDGKYYALDLTWDVGNKKNNTCEFNFFCRQNKQDFYSYKYHDLKHEREEVEYNVEVVPVELLQKTLTKITENKIYMIPTKKLNGKESCEVNNIEIIINNTVPVAPAYEMLSTYIRQDGTSFIIIPTNRKINNVYEYVYFEYDNKSGRQQLKGAKIYSEINLVIADYEMRENIANNLLSQERIKNKINNFNGYVGYIEKGSNYRYYNQYFEEQILNIYR